MTERSSAIRERGQFPLLLRPSVAGNARSCELWTDAIEVPNLRFDIPGDIPALKSLLLTLRLDGIEIQHFLHLDERVIELVRALKRPYDAYVHDYAWICPRVAHRRQRTLLRGASGVSLCILRQTQWIQSG